jgi:hypothetical protein
MNGRCARIVHSLLVFLSVALFFTGVLVSPFLAGTHAEYYPGGNDEACGCDGCTGIPTTPPCNGINCTMQGCGTCVCGFWVDTCNCWKCITSCP